MPELSPLAIQLDDPTANNALYGKERGKSRRKSLNFGVQSQPFRNPDEPDPGLNDVTNASPTGRKSTVLSKETARDADLGTLDIRPTPVQERRTKKSQLLTPSLAEDVLMHGNSGKPSERRSFQHYSTSMFLGDSNLKTKTDQPSVMVSAGSLALPQSSSKNRSSSPADPSGKSETEAASEEEGRERRVRKSINYAEPKLNT
jgi:hypothetical protein